MIFQKAEITETVNKCQCNFGFWLRLIQRTNLWSSEIFTLHPVLQQGLFFKFNLIKYFNMSY